MDDISKLNHQQAEKDKSALKLTISKMIKMGYIDNSLNPIEGYREDFVTKIFNNLFENLRKRAILNVDKYVDIFIRNLKDTVDKPEEMEHNGGLPYDC